MQGIDFPEKTHDFGKPDGWKDEDCYSLPVAKTFYRNIEGQKVPCLISKWKPSDADIAAIVAGDAIWLTITGEGMPPVSLRTDNPF